MLPPSDSDEEDEVPAAKKPGQVTASSRHGACGSCSNRLALQMWRGCGEESQNAGPASAVCLYRFSLCISVSSVLLPLYACKRSCASYKECIFLTVVTLCAQPATAGMLPPSSSDEDDSSEEEEEPKPKLRTPQPAVVSTRPCAPVSLLDFHCLRLHLCFGTLSATPLALVCVLQFFFCCTCPEPASNTASLLAMHPQLRPMPSIAVECTCAVAGVWPANGIK